MQTPKNQEEYLEDIDMISCNNSSSNNFFKVIPNYPFIKVFLFFVALLFIILTGCSSPRSTRATAEEEYKAQEKLTKLQNLVDEEDYMNAKYVMSGFKKDYSHTNLYKKYSNRINAFAKRINKETKNIKYDDKIIYLYAPPRPETKVWKEYMSRAESIVSRNRSGMGITVLRLFFEDENLENPSVMIGCGPYSCNSSIYIFSPDGGYSNSRSIQNRDAVYVGSSFWRYSIAEPNDKDASVIGNVMIGGIYHYPITLKVEVQKGKVTAFGNVIVRCVPQEYRGNLSVNVQAEDSLKLNDAEVSLKVYGFYYGITRPIKENHCLFDSIGPGKYNMELAKNNSFGSPVKSAEVILGKTTEVTINAYRHRIIDFDWRFRRSNEPNNWLSGRATIKTKEYWQPDNEWPDVRYPVFALGDWINNSCQIRPSNGYLMYVGNNESFEEMAFPLYFSSSSRGYPVKEGDIFAWRRDEQKGGFLEALIHIKKITPIGLPDDYKSPAQKE
ncbi:MAG: hypothetical protein ABII09_05635 [Planctomycetota bacterium]